MKKIRDLGSLPAEAFEKYRKSNVKQVTYSLHFSLAFKIVRTAQISLNVLTSPILCAVFCNHFLIALFFKTFVRKMELTYMFSQSIAVEKAGEMQRRVEEIQPC